MVSGFFLLFGLFVLSHSDSEPFHDYQYPEELVKAIDLTATYIYNTATNDNGTFKYETLGDQATIKYPLVYNSVRHAGTIWSLTLYIQYKWYTEHDLVPDCREAAIATTKYLQKLIVSPNDGETTFNNFKGMLTTSETELEEREDEFALGGSALALVSLASMQELNLLETDIEILRGIGHFIIHFMDSNGDFPSHYFIQGQGIIDTRTCDYFPGEAALALIKLYAVDEDIQWLEAARDILEVLARKHLEEELFLVDHWYLISCQHIFKYQDIIDLPKNLLFAGCVKFAYFAIENPRDNWCASNAIYEGLTAASLLFKYEFGLGHDYDGLYDGLLDYVTPGLIDGTQKLIACQGKGGGIARGLKKLNTDKYYVRIDYCQHTLSAWIRTYEFLYEHYVPLY